MNNQDARVRVTKEMLHRALLRMLKDRPIGAISVKDLCAEAGINRGTFYLHYGQPQDVLKEIECLPPESSKTIRTDHHCRRSARRRTILREVNRCKG